MHARVRKKQPFPPPFIPPIELLVRSSDRTRYWFLKPFLKHRRGETLPTRDAQLRLATVDLVCWCAGDGRYNPNHLLSLARLYSCLYSKRLVVPYRGDQSCSVLCFLYTRVAKLQHNGAEIAAGSVESLQGITEHEWLNCLIFFARNQWQLFGTSKSFHAKDRAPSGCVCQIR